MHERLSGWRDGVVRIAALAVLAGGGSAACGNASNAPGPTPSAGTATEVATSSAASGTATPSSVNPVTDRVLAAYLGMWRATAAASRTSDWQSPELPQYARDAALQKITQALHADRERGVTAQGEPKLAPRVTDLVPPEAPVEARVLDCADDSGWLKYRADGQLVDDEPGGRRRITAVLKVDAGAWKVTDFAIQGVGSC